MVFINYNVINKLIKASNRGVDIKIIFDRSKDAFGMSTNGVPNKPVAKKLLRETKNKIQVKLFELLHFFVLTCYIV